MSALISRRVLRVLAGPALWLCACSLLTTPTSAQCTSPTQVPNGTYTSGDHSQVDNNALRASGFGVSGGATATFAAGNCIHLAPGFRANAVGATVPTTFQAWVDSAPTAVSVSPSAPPQNPSSTQSFTWTVSAPGGASNLSHVFALFNTTSSSTANACYIHYDASSNLVFLADNASTTWLGGFAPSSSNSASNSQCAISGTGSTLNPTRSGAQLGLTLNVTFQSAAFSGSKNQYMYALNAAGVTSGWQQMGTWTVPGPPAPDFTLTTPLSYQSVQPNAAVNLSFTLNVTPQNGFNSSVSFGLAWPMYGCSFYTFTPYSISGPPWTTTLTLSCYPTIPNTYSTRVVATGGGKTRELDLYMLVGQNSQYLSTSVSPQGGGSIAPASGWFTTGSTVTITAVPVSSYQFSGFTGVDSSNGTTGYVTMNGPRNVTANFTQMAQVGAPSFSPTAGTYPSPQNVAITSATSGASIRYTLDGSTPTSTTGTLYTSQVSVGSTATIRAIAYKSGMADSAVSAATYTITGAVAPPSFSPAGGTYSSAQTVAITSTTAGASIRYTTDGSTPTSTTGTPYTGSVSVAATTTLKAIAFKTGMADSAVTSSTYTITPGVVASPTFSPAGGTYSSNQNVTISSTTAGNTIRYTTDGTNPTQSAGTVYAGPVPVSSNMTIKAIAFKTGMTDSPVTSATYVIQGATSTQREYIWIGGRVIAIENKEP